MTLKDHIQGRCKFIHYRQGNLLYQTSTGYNFIVPIEDTNDATFPAEDKGILFMRWIRKAINEGTLVKL
jgi:hypothetical protein